MYLYSVVVSAALVFRYFTVGKPADAWSGERAAYCIFIPNLWFMLTMHAHFLRLLYFSCCNTDTRAKCFPAAQDVLFSFDLADVSMYVTYIHIGGNNWSIHIFKYECFYMDLVMLSMKNFYASVVYIFFHTTGSMMTRSKVKVLCFQHKWFVLR